jgi:hypothetical protein
VIGVGEKTKIKSRRGNINTFSIGKIISLNFKNSSRGFI